MTHDSGDVSGLTAFELLALQCKVMRLNEQQALAFLKGEGHEVSAPTYWRARARIKKKSLQRAFKYAGWDFLELHMQRIDNLQTIERELWRQYVLEPLPHRKAKILVQIAEVQPFLASFYRSTRKVLERQKVMDNPQSNERAHTLPGPAGK